MSMTPTHTRVDDWSAYELANQAMRLTVIPELGGKILTLDDACSGRSWLWRNPYLPLRTPEAGGVYIESFDSGGWDEVFPSVDPCAAGSVGGAWGDHAITDHGELWCRPWSVQACDGALKMFVDDPALPFRFERTLRLAPDEGPLTFDYTLVNQTEKPLPYIWATHPLIAIEPGMRIDVPPGVKATCTGGDGEGLPPLNQPFDWPHNGSHDLSRVPQRGQAGYAVKLFTEPMDQASVTLTPPDGSAALKLTMAAGASHRVGMWLNYDGWSGAKTTHYFNAGIEPTTTPADRLDLSAADGAAAVLGPRGTVQWALRVELV